MLNTTMNAYYIYGNADYNGVSYEKFDTQEEAVQACIDHMRKQKEEGYKVSDQVIIRVDTLTIRDEFYTLKTQEIKTTVETINKHYVEA